MGAIDFFFRRLTAMWAKLVQIGGLKVLVDSDAIIENEAFAIKFVFKILLVYLAQII